MDEFQNQKIRRMMERARLEEENQEEKLQRLKRTLETLREEEIFIQNGRAMDWAIGAEQMLESIWKFHSEQRYLTKKQAAAIDSISAAALRWLEGRRR